MNSKQKGNRAERAFANLLKAHGFNARRGQQFSGSPDSPDVVCENLSEFHFEVKSVERLNVDNAMEQAGNDRGLNQMPVVAHKKNRGEWMITMLFDDWVELVKQRAKLGVPAITYQGVPIVFDKRLPDGVVLMEDSKGKTTRLA